MSGTRSLECEPPLNGALPANLHHAVAAAGLGLLMAAAAAVLWRQAAGALRHPLQPAVLLAAAVAATAAAVAVRASWLVWCRRLACTSPGRRDACTTWLDRIVTIVLSLAVVELTVGLCLPGTPAACLAVVGIVVATEEAWAWVGHLRRSTSRRVPNSRGLTAPGKKPGQLREFRELLAPGCNSALPSEGVVQQLTRSRAANGTEEISGWLRTSFVAGQRTASIHVAFCPPLGATPELSVEQIDGPEARIKTAQVLPYGARLDLKLAAASEEPASVLLQFVARAP